MFGYCAIVISALCWPSLLTPIHAYLCIGIAAILLRWSKLLAGGLFAVAWVSLFSHQLLTFQTSENHSSIETRAEIISLVYRNSDRISADIRLLGVNSSTFVQRYMRVNWPETIPVRVGEVWQLQIQPKPIASTLNQGGFNRQRYYLSKHIIGTGKVIIAERVMATENIRTRFNHHIIDKVLPLSNGDLLLALMVGDKQFITDEHWQGLRQSGTGHLIAISGLHLSVLALWALFIARLMLAQFNVTQSIVNLKLAAMMALGLCIVYAYLSGFSLPTQRALIMLALVIVLSFLRRYSTSFERLLWALFIVLLIDPLSMMSAGFWLSFGALGIILSFMQQLGGNKDVPARSMRKRMTKKALQFWSLQWRLSLLLGALQMLLFGGVAPYALLFNLLFVPWFSLVVIPLTFIVMLLSSVGLATQGILVGLNSTISPLTWSFHQLQHLPLTWLSASEDLSLALLFLLLAFFLLRLITKPLWRVLALVFLLPSALLMARPFVDINNRSNWKLHLLDVGQGLSAIIERQGRVVIYDTGAAFGEDFSYAKRVIIPFLQYQGIDSVDYLILSHADNDHAGGAQDLLSQYPGLQLITDIEMPFSVLPQPMSCRPKHLVWQGLSLQILAPREPRAGNNGSCVLKVSDDQYQLLLPGDIESEAEQELIQTYAAFEGNVLTSDVLVAPHHGSNTSSSEAFIHAVSPQLVLYPAGLHNRYHFPKTTVVERYKVAQSEQYMVGRNGQLSVIFEQDDLKVRGFRYDISPFWYNRVFEFGLLENTRVE
nr:DNA internalization-related competence protein ComEC/Rec2 [Shewanella sp. Isolate11]